jgi:hypothetical protein
MFWTSFFTGNHMGIGFRTSGWDSTQVSEWPRMYKRWLWNFDNHVLSSQRRYDAISGFSISSHGTQSTSNIIFIYYLKGLPPKT